MMEAMRSKCEKWWSGLMQTSSANRGNKRPIREVHAGADHRYQGSIPACDNANLRELGKLIPHRF
jgi:hypothetical protein